MPRSTAAKSPKLLQGFRPLLALELAGQEIERDRHNVAMMHAPESLRLRQVQPEFMDEVEVLVREPGRMRPEAEVLVPSVGMDNPKRDEPGRLLCEPLPCLSHVPGLIGGRHYG